MEKIKNKWKNNVCHLVGEIEKSIIYSLRAVNLHYTMLWTLGMRYYQSAKIEPLSLPGGAGEVTSKDLSLGVGLKGWLGIC